MSCGSVNYSKISGYSGYFLNGCKLLLFLNERKQLYRSLLVNACKLGKARQRDDPNCFSSSVQFKYLCYSFSWLLIFPDLKIFAYSQEILLKHLCLLI